MPGYLGASLTEGFLRKYQVLPGRTHPMMNASGSGGFILHVLKVYVHICGTSPLFLISVSHLAVTTTQLRHQ